MTPAGARRHLWLTITGPGKPEYGRWKTPLGRDVTNTLARKGPPGVTVEWWFQQNPANPGKTLVDVVWQDGEGLKVYSERLCSLLADQGAELSTFPIDVRYNDGSPIAGYLGVLEETKKPGPVHSMKRGQRTGSVAVSEQVRQSMLDARITGAEFEPFTSAFPGDNGYFD